jgi:hypothetical protein
MGFISSRGYGCFSIFLIPIVIIFSIIIANGVNKASTENTIYYILAATGITLIVNASTMFSITGLTLIGIYLTLLPVLGGYGDSLFFIILILVWVALKYKKVNIVSVTVFTVLCVMIIAFMPDVESNFIDFTRRTTETETEEHLQEQKPDIAELYPGSDQSEDTGRTRIKLNNELGDIDMQNLLPEGSLLIILSLGAFIMGYMFWKASSIKGFWKAFSIGLLLIVFIVGIRFLLILFIENSRGLTIAEGLSFGQGLSGEIGDAPIISLQPLQAGDYREVEVTIPRGFHVFIVIGLTTLGVLLMGFIIHSMLSKSWEGKRREKGEEEVPESVPLFSLKEFPTFSKTREYILGAYWWIRRKYFAGMHHLTPYELFEREISKEMNLEEFKEAFSYLTEVYVNIHYGNKTVDEVTCRNFEKALLKVDNYLTNLETKQEQFE